MTSRSQPNPISTSLKSSRPPVAMHPLSSAELLTVWESGLNQGTDQQALRLLLAAMPEKTEADLKAFSIGERDYHLMRLRHQLFGSRFDSVSQCPNCKEQLQWDSDIRELYALGREAYPVQRNPIIQTERWTIRLRPLSHSDINALLQEPDETAKPEQLLRASVLAIKNQEDDTVAFEQLSKTDRNAIVNALQAADPLARVDIDLTCPACDHRWQALFDIASFLWAEINAWALRTLHGIHLLASNYGWTEQDILAMTPTRRQIYLDMVAR